MTFKCMDRMLSNNEANSISIPNSSITVPKKVKAKSQQKLSTSDRLNTLLYHMSGPPKSALSLRTCKILIGF